MKLVGLTILATWLSIYLVPLIVQYRAFWPNQYYMVEIATVLLAWYAVVKEFSQKA